MRFRPMFAAFAAITLFGQPASAYLAQNNLLVVPAADGTFSVPFRGLSGDSEFWCAAGDYVINRLRKPGGTPIFRMSEPPRRSGQGITFSLSPEGAATRTGVAVFGDGPKGSVSASMAWALCPPRFWPFFRF